MHHAKLYWKEGILVICCSRKLSFIYLLIKLFEKTQLSNFNGTDYRATELY